MSGTAPVRFAAWMAAHEHRDAKKGFVYLYHSRSDAHSKELARLVLEDLIIACPSLRADAEADKIVYGINCVYTFPISNKQKTLDFMIAKGQPDLGADRLGSVLAPAKVLRPVKVGNRWVKQLAIDSVLVSCEIKAVMTEHVKSKPRVFDELSSSHEIVHQGDPRAVAAGLTVVNIAQTFVSPLRQFKDQPLVISKHKQPQAAEAMIQHLRGLPIRQTPTGQGFDAYATLVIDCDNQRIATLWTDPPAPQPGEKDHYDTFLFALSRAYEERLAK